LSLKKPATPVAQDKEKTSPLMTERHSDKANNTDQHDQNKTRLLQRCIEHDIFSYVVATRRTRVKMIKT
jgi:hypothetical protein